MDPSYLVGPLLAKKQLHFKGESSSSLKIVRAAKSMMKETSSENVTRRISPLVSNQMPNVDWPHDGGVVFTDASFKKENGEYSGGYVMWLNGVSVCAWAFYGSRASSTKEAEARMVLIVFKDIYR